MRKLAAGGMLALMVVVTPLPVWAKAGPFDEAQRATIVMMAQETAVSIRGGTLPDAEAPGIVREAPNPQPENVEPEPTAPSEPTAQPSELPELNLVDLVEYTSQGVTFLAPADWEVETDLSEDNPFIIRVPGTGFAMSLESQADLDFPSWLGVALFRSQGELLVQQTLDDALVEESTTIYTDQNLPVAKLAFSGMDDGEHVGGAFYALAPNERAYLLVAGGTAAEWAYAAPGVDFIAQSLFFDEELVTVQHAEVEPLLFTDSDETVQVAVPADWYVMATDDPQFPVIAAEPEVRFVAAIGTGSALGDNFDPSILDTFVPDASDFGDDEKQALLDDILDMVARSGSNIDVDEEASTVIPRTGALTVKLVGSAQLDQASIPIVFYIDLREAGVGVVAVFGDTASALAVEEEIQSMVESVTEQ